MAIVKKNQFTFDPFPISFKRTNHGETEMTTSAWALWFRIYYTFIDGFFRKSFEKLFKVFRRFEELGLVIAGQLVRQFEELDS